MDRIEYTLTADDLLRFNLYYASVSPNHAKQRRKHRVMFPALFIIIALLFLRENAYVWSVSYALFAVGWFLLSPSMMRRRYRNHYKKHIAETAGDDLPQNIILELLPDSILWSSHIGESKSRFDAIDRIVKHDGYTYIFFGKGAALILPHDRLSDQTLKLFVEEVQTKMQASH